MSSAYLVGTLLGALGLPLIGRIGVSRAMTLVGIGFGVALVGMAGVQGFVTLAVGFAAIRLLGQGSLILVNTVAVTLWFERRRGLVLGVFATGTAVLMSLVPVGLSLVIEAYDWRVAWVTAAVMIWLVVVPIGRYGLIDRPADVGQQPDGVSVTADQRGTTPTQQAATRREALRTARFWALAAASASVGMLVTGLNFHQISLLGDAGLTPTEAAIMFLPQVIGAAIAGLLFGYLSDRLAGRWLIPMVMATLTTSLLLAANLTGVTIVLYAISLGAATGAFGSVVSALLPRWFGVDHIGEIQGTAKLVAVGSSAVGPILFSLAHGAAGNYSGAAQWIALIPVAVGIATLMLRTPPENGRSAAA